MAHASGATRRELASASGQFVAIRGWERLGFARLGDYAIERLGVSARELQDLARVDAALAVLPGVSAALAGGRISWTKARLLARVATREDEERWLGIAKALSARALAREVRRMDLHSLETDGSSGSSAESEVRGDTLVLHCTPTVKAKWHRARLLANRVAGQALAPWQCAENVAAEVLSAVPLDGPVPGADAGGLVSALAVPQAPDGARRLPRAERRTRVARPSDGLDAFGLDAHLRELVGREQRVECELSEQLREVAERRLHRTSGFPTLDAYAQDALGISPRKARMLLRLARAARRVPALGDAWRSGALSFMRAYTLVPVVLAAPEHAGAWIHRARRVPFLRLEEEVSAAMTQAEVDPAGFAATGGAPATSTVPDIGGPARRQAGAQATPPEESHTSRSETSRLMLHGPRDAIGLFRATLCTVRRHLERRTGRCPTPGEAFEAMLDHAFAEWLPQQAPRARRAQRVYERDGWRCTAPGCSSYRNLQDHHVVFRSQGGSDALENRTTLCAWHHLRGVHAGRMRCTGTAPHRLRFELGLRRGRPPLLVYENRRAARGA